MAKKSRKSVFAHHLPHFCRRRPRQIGIFLRRDQITNLLLFTQEREKKMTFEAGESEKRERNFGRKAVWGGAIRNQDSKWGCPGGAIAVRVRPGSVDGAENAAHSKCTHQSVWPNFVLELGFGKTFFCFSTHTLENNRKSPYRFKRPGASQPSVPEGRTHSPGGDTGEHGQASSSR